MTTDQAAGSAYGIKGFPTIKFFGNNKSKPADYSGAREASPMMDYAFGRAQKIAKARAFYTGKNSGSSSGSGSNNQKKEQKKTGGSSGKGDGKVVVLTDSNFNQQVYNSGDVWMVEFYAPWCGHCKRLQPEWEAAARDVRNVKWAKVDCTTNKSTCGQFGIQGYPTIKAFAPGASSSSDALPFNGGRTKSDLSSYAEGLAAENVAAKELKQLTGQADYNEYCAESNGVCFIFLLPHILDSSEAERKESLDMLTEVNFPTP